MNAVAITVSHYPPDNIPEAIPITNDHEIIIPFSPDTGKFYVVTMAENKVSARLYLESTDGILLHESRFKDLFLRRKLLIEKGNCSSCRVKINGWTEKEQASVKVQVNQYDTQVDFTRYQAEKLSNQAFSEIDSEKDESFEKAVVLFNQSMAFWQKTNDFRELANNYFLLGETKDDALTENPPRSDYIKLKDLSVEHEDSFIQARAEIALGQLEYRQGNYKKACHHYKTVEKNPLLQSSFENTAHLVHFLQGELHNEIALINIKTRKPGTSEKRPECESNGFSKITAKEVNNNESILIENTLSKAYDHFYQISDAGNMADVLNNLGYFYRLDDKLDLAAAKHSVAYQLSKQSSANQGITMRTLYHMGVVSGRRGRYFHALELLDKAEKEAMRLQTLQWRAHIKASQARFNLDLGRLALGKKQFDEASHMYLQVNAQADMHTIYLHLGRLYTEMGDFEKAEYFFTKAKSSNEAMTSEDHRRNVLNAQILSLIKQQRFQEALPLQEQLLAPALASKNVYFTGRNLTQLADILYALNRNKESLDYAKQAAELQKNTGDDLYYIKSTHLIAKNLQSFAESPEIINLYLNEGINKIEEIRQSLTNDNLRREYFGLQKALFESKIAVQLLQENPGKDEILNALTIAESYKARTLYELLIQKNADEISEKKERSVSFEDMNSEDQLKQAFKIFSQKVINHIPIYKKPFTRVQIEAYLKSLPANEVILYYFSGHHKTYVWLLSANDIALLKIDGDKTINEVIVKAEYGLSQPPTGWGTANSLSELYGNLGQASDLLLGKHRQKLVNYTHLRIFPDSSVHRIPFAMLLSTKKIPLIASHSISEGFSLTTDTVLHQPHSDQKGIESLLLIAPYTGNQKRSLAQAPLRHTKAEADTIAQLWRNKNNITLLTDEMASKGQIENALTKQFSILHFASHAKVDWDYPELSSISLYPTAHANESTTNLQVNDITRWKISAELVVLSACETAAGKNILGEGPMGLARAFIDAGSRRVLASYWPIDDEATAILMKHFYNALLDKKLSPPDALREAQLELSKIPKWSHPFYWSGIGLFGSKNSWLENQE
ncbi:MAG TPA: CHAT domain-containing tetratricopeptide repeat protein [Cellvibrio sp.]|nr:CHAT domain-containing tetratricopeptide repeat protein [Cellvibrio sp.]